MYKIGELSRLCRIPVKTLRYYDNEGVLVPDEIDRFTGYRSMLSQIHEIDYQIIGASYEIYYEDGTVELKIPVCKKVKCMDPTIEKRVFENDEAVVGRWEIRDIVMNKEQFVYGSPKCPEAENTVWKEICFPEGGEPYWFLKGWTKGFLYLEATDPAPHLVAMPYSVESMNGHTILFLEIPRRYEDGSRDAVPQLLVFEKVPNIMYRELGDSPLKQRFHKEE